MAPWWFDVLGFAELVFVTCFFVTEALRLALRDRVNRLERTAQVIPPERFFQQVAAPLVTAVAGILVAIGAIWYTSNNGLQSYLGLLMIVFSMVVLGRYLVQFAAGSGPRPVARARVHRALAEAGERLESGAPLNPDEAARLRARLGRMSQLGERLLDRAGGGGGQRWREAARSEPRWLACAVVAAITVPAAGVITVSVHLAEGRSLARGLAALGVCLALVAATVVAAVLRRIRCRRDMRDLGADVKARSQVLLGRLAEITSVPPSAPSSPARAPSLRVLWRKLVRGPAFRGPRL